MANTELRQLNKSEYWSVVNAAGEILDSGRIEPGLRLTTSSPTIVHNQNENSYLDEINQVGTVSDPLPAEGTELEAGVVYSWNGQNVIVRQEHTRTHHDPDTVPALFLFYRAVYEGMEWIENESVLIGDERTHEAIKYECIQPHVTVAGQTPGLTPALWVVIPDGSGEWQAGVQVYSGAGEEPQTFVMHLGIEYKCLQNHVTQVGWEPDVVPALWSLV